MTVFLGDIHGNFNVLEDVAARFPNETVIQVGDFGLGFGNDPETLPKNVRFIRGNHDDLKVCRNYPEWIADGTVETIKNGKFKNGTNETIKDGNIMYIGGAWSIDWAYRTPGRDWWDDEELNEYQWPDMEKIYLETKPVLMVTHDIPYKVREQTIVNQFNDVGPNRTSFWLQEMFNKHEPMFWIHGHHHTSYVKKIGECTFIGLGINAFIDLHEV